MTSYRTGSAGRQRRGLPAWAITAGDANDVPAVKVKGAAGVNIRWHVVVQGSEVVVVY